MIEQTKFRRIIGLAVVAVALAGAGCGTGSVDEPAAEGAGSPAADAAPLPELRTNDAGAVLVSQEEMVRLLDAGTAPLILDVRTPEEFAEGHVPGAVLIPHTELADRLAEIDAAREAGVIVYCRSGRRAGIAEELLLAQGFANVQHLEGDMNAWREANLPLQTPQR